MDHISGIKKHYLAGLLLACVAFLHGCGATKILPIQITRAPQVEYYQQSIVIEDAPWPPGNWSGDEDVIEQQRRLTKRLDSYLSYMIGEQNWLRLKETYGLPSMRDELMAGKINIRGYLNMVLAIDPDNTEQFYAEGTGRFFLVREVNNEVLLSGDFRVIPQRHWISELNEGFIDIDIWQLITRVPVQPTYLYDTRIRYRIYIDTTRAERNVYAIDYSRAHPVYMVNSDLDIDNDTIQVGYLRFDDTLGSAKLLDLRGREFLRNDYGKRDELPAGEDSQ